MSHTVPPDTDPLRAARPSGDDDPDLTLPVPSVVVPPLTERPQPAPAAAAEPAADLRGQRLGAWTLCRQIGHGGMGEVWLAERSDGLFQAQAAIKLLRSDLPAQQLAARFARERALLARLDHPAIARLLDAGVDQGRAYLVLEYVQGKPLAEHVRQHCPDVASRVRLMMQVAEAVDHAHARLVVHRDLKPANVRVGADGTPKLLDFGIAGMLGDDDAVDGQLTRLTGRRVTLAYAAPEQVTGEPVGVTADVFSLGVMLFQLLSGDMPFGSESSSRVAAEHALLHDEAPRLARSASGASAAPRSPLQPEDPQRVRGDLEAIVAKALRKQPAARYGSMRALIDDLQRWLDHRPVSVRRDDWRHRVRLWLQRNAVGAAAGAALLLALSVGLAASLWQWQRAEAAARTSQAVTAYLGELLSSAQPDRHSGQVPTVMQLLETSRQDLAQRFADSPATQERLLEVLGQTYLALNRSDLALPLARQRVATAAALDGGTGSRSLLARLDLARILAMREAFDQVVSTAEPLRRELPRRLGEQSDSHRNLLYVLAYAYVRLSRFDEGRSMLTQAQRVTEAMYPPGDFQRLFHHNHVQVLEVSAGRLREGLAALKLTEPHWDSIPSDQQRMRHTLERNMIAVQVRLGEYDGLLERGTALLQRIDALMGAGSDQAAGLRAELARGLAETGRHAEAWQQRQAVLDQAPGGLAGRQPAQALPERAQTLLARALAQPQVAATLVSQARALMGELDRHGPDIGLPGLEARAALLRAALVLGERSLAAAALRTLRDDPRLAGHRALRSRVDQLDGALRRWSGDLDGSRTLLQARVKDQLDLVETRTPRAWSALLDLATTLVDLGDPAAAQVLQQALQTRPAGMPADVPLDRLQAWLQARLRHGDDRAAPVRKAWAELARRVSRDPGAARSAVLASTVF